MLELWEINQTSSPSSSSHVEDFRLLYIFGGCHQQDIRMLCGLRPSAALLRPATALRVLPHAARGLATAADAKQKPPLIEKSLDDGVLTLTFSNEKKLNAWTMPLMKQLFTSLDEAAAADDVKGVVITGSGKYYSAGVDLSSMIQPMAPAKLVREIRNSNEKCFGMFLNFPKPIVAAVNGPAIGAAVTSTVLMDSVIASESASFSLPFAKLGVPPEGCSSVTWPERLGDESAQRMLGPENWTPSGVEAHAVGLVDELVPPDALVARAVAKVRERIAAGGGRRFDAAESARLNKVNAEESATLANAFVSPKFLNAMYDFNTKRGKSQLKAVFWLAKTTLPLWQPAKIVPSYDEK